MKQLLCDLVLPFSTPPVCVPTTFWLLLDHWQTLVSGLLALGGAGISLFYLHKQIKAQGDQLGLQKEAIDQQRVALDQQREATDQQQRQFEEKLRREEAAARIRIPHALSKFTRYNHSAMLAWEKQDPSARGQPPHDAIETLMEVAVAIDPRSYQSVQMLVQHMQVFEDRLDAKGNAWSSAINEEDNRLRNMILDAAKMKYLVDRLYDYGRDRSREVPYSPPTMEQLYDIASGYFLDNEETQRRIDEAIPVDASYRKKYAEDAL